MKLILTIIILFFVNLACSQQTKTVWLKIGDSRQAVRIYKYRNSKDFVMLSLHDDERTAVKAAQTVLKKRGGTLLRLVNNNQRYIRFLLKKKIYVFDPNRIFSREGIRANLRELSVLNEDAVEEIEEFAEDLLGLVPGKPACLLALHNNTNGAYSINFYKPGGKFGKDVSELKVIPGQDPDDFFLATNVVLYQQLAKAGYNSILQDNENASDDGSLSVYYGKRNLNYLNCEAQHGKLSKNINMLNTALELIKVL